MYFEKGKILLYSTLIGLYWNSVEQLKRKQQLKHTNLLCMYPIEIYRTKGRG